MGNDTFFDLQRFDDEVLSTTALGATNAAKDTLVGNSEGLTWAGGGSFGGTGTEEDPAYLSATGASAITDTTEIYLKGTKAGYNFAVAGDAVDWNADIQGTGNVVRSDLADGTYGINGQATVNVNAGRTFNENVNDALTYVRASKAADVPVVVKTDGFSDAGMEYTFNNVSSVAVGVDSDDTAVFNGTSTDITLGGAASGDSVTIAGFAFSDNTTVTSNGSYVFTGVKDGTSVTAGGDTWKLNNKSSRDDAFVSVNATNGEVDLVYASESVVLNGELNSSVTTAIGRGRGSSIETMTWNQITGGVNEVTFTKNGANVNNTITDANDSVTGYGAVTVNGSGSNVGFSGLDTEGITANGVKIQATNASIDTFAVDLSDGDGIDGIAFDTEDAAVKVSGDAAFEVKTEQNTYNVSTTADNISLDVVKMSNSSLSPGNYIFATVVAGQSYAITGGDAVYEIEDVAAKGKAAVSLNGAGVTINNGATAPNGYLISTDADKQGVDEVMLLKPNDAINVANDSDGYTAYFNTVPTSVSADSIVTFTANGAQISVEAQYVNDNVIRIISDGGNDVTVQGIEGNAVVSVASGDTVYHFKNSLSRNEVTTDSSTAYTQITLTAGGDVMTVPTSGRVEDVIDDNDTLRVANDQSKWDEIASVGGSDDSVESNHAQLYEDFYNLAGSSIAGNTVAGYASDSVAASEGESNINIIGNTVLSDAAHITLNGGSEVGRVPINIQADENSNAVDVTVNLTNGSQPSTVAVGTEGLVTASHDVRLSNAGTATDPSTGYIGSLATGENVLRGGTGYNMLRHDGDNRASIFGGSGQDTIRGAVNDVVSGGDAADYFYDLSGYALDYNVAEGDVIIASRLSSLDEISASNIIRGTGNQVGFGNGEYLLTLANVDPNSAVYMKVGVMDNDGNVVQGTRDVALANGNGVVDATTNNLSNALIVANSSRGEGVHAVIGSQTDDTVYVGAYDTVSGAAGDDKIIIDTDADGVVVAMSEGNDSVEGWTFGFDRAQGATQLNTDGRTTSIRGRVFEDRLYISLEGSASSISFEETKQLGNAQTMHGQYDVLVDDKKVTGIRSGDAGMGYASVTSNDDVADFYFAEREGVIIFTEGVTKKIGTEIAGSDYGWINLADVTTFQDIRQLTLDNNSKTAVIGSADRETVSVGGAEAAGAYKAVSLAGGNDFIASGGDNDSIASHTFYFGTGDGRDSIVGFNHYSGVAADPDYQSADMIAVQSLAGVRSEYSADENAVRVEFAVTDSDYAVVYETVDNYNYDANMYRVAIGDKNASGLAKIGYSTTANTFTYNKEASFYVGSSGQAVDTLNINENGANVQIYLDGSQDVNGDGTKEFYRGIGIVNASTAINTNLTIAGAAADEMLIGGGAGTRSFLWGNGGTNTLVGGEGADYFIYCKDANAWASGGADQSGTTDYIAGYNAANDFIVLNGVSLDDINYAAMAQAGGSNNSNYGITENAVTVSFKNGGSVQVGVTDQDKVSFYLGDGQGGIALISAERSTGAWKREA